jgi:hypothetical protein
MDTLTTKAHTLTTKDLTLTRNLNPSYLRELIELIKKCLKCCTKFILEFENFLFAHLKLFLYYFLWKIIENEIL